jgi:transmembrane sensor
MQHLIEKYLNGTASEEERRQVMEWYNQQADQPATWESTEDKSALKERMLNNLHRKIRKKNNILKYAAVFALLVVSFFIARHLLKGPEEKVWVVSTLTGQRKTVVLPDGTKVWLMHNSRITYRNERNVQLKGEAFFEVAKDESHPFTIHTGGLKTKVLGTSFNISAYDGDSTIKVTLLTGLLELSKHNNRKRLQPMQQAIYERHSDHISCADYPDANEMLLRREGQLEFKNVRVEEVVKELKENFKADIIVDEQTMNCLFFGRLKANEDLDKFLKKLCLILNANYEKKGNQYFISKGHC